MASLRKNTDELIAYNVHTKEAPVKELLINSKSQILFH
jgi:hypothetical protein